MIEQFRLTTIYTVLASAAVFFIRSDWPLGFDGDFLTAVGLAGIWASSAWAIGTGRQEFAVGACFWAAFGWLVISLLSAALSGLLLGQEEAAIALIFELTIDGLFILSAYSLVRVLKQQPAATLRAAVPWMLVTVFGILYNVQDLSTFRRADIVASKNYMAASAGVMLLFSLWAAWNERGMAVKRFLYVGSATVAGLGLIFLASRSAFLGVGTALVVAAMYRFKLRVPRLSRVPVSGAAAFLVAATLIALVGAGAVRIVRGVDFTLTLERFTEESVSHAVASRTELWREALPTTVPELAFGSPERYGPIGVRELSGSPNTASPHNQSLSVVAFSGVFSLLAFWVLTVVMVLGAHRNAVNAANRRISSTMLMLIMVSIALVVYTSVSGKFTRNWHLYWIIGLVGGFVDEVEYKRAAR